MLHKLQTAWKLSERKAEHRWIQHSALRAILFCEQWCWIVSVAAVRKERHDGFALVFRTLCKLDSCVKSCTGGNAHRDTLFYSKHQSYLLILLYPNAHLLSITAACDYTQKIRTESFQPFLLLLCFYPALQVSVSFYYITLGAARIISSIILGPKTIFISSFSLIYILFRYPLATMRKNISSGVIGSHILVSLLFWFLFIPLSSC